MKRYYARELSAEDFDYSMYYDDACAKNDHFFAKGDGFCINEDFISDIVYNLDKAVYNIKLDLDNIEENEDTDSDEERDIMIAQMVDNGEISEAEAYRMTREYRGLNNKGFLAFKADLEAKLGCKITRATKFEKGVVFEEEGQQMLFLNENSKN